MSCVHGNCPHQPATLSTVLARLQRCLQYSGLVQLDVLSDIAGGTLTSATRLLEIGFLRRAACRLFTTLWHSSSTFGTLLNMAVTSHPSSAGPVLMMAGTRRGTEGMRGVVGSELCEANWTHEGGRLRHTNSPTHATARLNEYES